MERRFQTGTVVSAIGHGGLILWVLVGGWLFRAERPPETITMLASTISSAEFDALRAAATLTPSKEPAAVRPQARPKDVVKPPPETPKPETPKPETPPPETPVVEPPPETPPEPVVTPPPSDVPQAAEEQAIQTESTEIQPVPEAAAIIAPDPVTPETDAQASDTPKPAVTDQPSDAPVVQQQPTEATVAPDAGDVTLTEANRDQTAETGMTTSVRPRSRPDRPAPAPKPAVAEVQPAKDPAPAQSAEPNVQPVDDTQTQDAIDALLGEATQEPAPEATADAGGQDLPQGPPLTGGEMGNISSAIARKWNLGASSTDAMSSTVVIRVSFSQDGTPVDFQLIESDGPSQSGIDRLYETARRAVNRAYQDGGLPLPADKYETWRVLDLVFDANGMRAR